MMNRSPGNYCTHSDYYPQTDKANPEGTPVIHDVLRSGNVVAAALAESLDKPFPWAVGFLFGNTEPSLELWTVIAGISGLDD